MLMAAKDILLIGMVFLFLSGISFAGCSYDSFKAACDDCTFDAYGKMDQSCWQGYQSSGTTCLGKKYPMMSAKYMMGDCPQVDECAAKLAACKDANNPGSNLLECKNSATLNCFTMGDACVEAANKICAEGKSETDAGWNGVFTQTPLTNQTVGNVTQNATANVTATPSSDTDSMDNLIDFLCPGTQGFILLFGAVLFFYKRS